MSGEAQKVKEEVKSKSQKKREKEKAKKKAKEYELELLDALLEAVGAIPTGEEDVPEEQERSPWVKGSGGE